MSHLFSFLPLGPLAENDPVGGSDSTSDCNDQDCDEISINFRFRNKVVTPQVRVQIRLQLSLNPDQSTSIFVQSSQNLDRS